MGLGENPPDPIGLFAGVRRMVKKIWNDYSLGLILLFLFVSNWIAYGITIAADSGPFSWRHFWEGTFENATSEFLQLAAFVVLSRYFIFKDSPQSKEGAERHERKTDYLIDINTVTKTSDNPEAQKMGLGTRWGGTG